MITLNPHTLFGFFALLTLILAAAAVGKVFGFGVWETVYLVGLMLGGAGWIVFRCSSHQREE